MGGRAGAANLIKVYVRMWIVYNPVRVLQLGLCEFRTRLIYIRWYILRMLSQPSVRRCVSSHGGISDEISPRAFRYSSLTFCVSPAAGSLFQTGRESCLSFATCSDVVTFFAAAE